METQPLVSVITPFYKSEEYLPETLKSFLAQTYPNMEMIVVDDCSPVAPDSLIPKAPKFPIRVIRTKKRSGPGAARNLGIKEARGPLIAFLDSDDLWVSTKIEKQVRVFTSQPDACWVYTDAFYFRDGDIFPKTQFRFVGLPRNPPQGRELNEFHLRGFNFITTSCILIAKRVIDDVGGFDETLKISEDWDLLARIAERYPVHVINEPLSYFRLKRSGAHYRFIEEYAKVAANIILRLYMNQGLLPERAPDMVRAFAKIYQFLGIQHMNGGNFKEARKAFFHPNMRPKRFESKIMALRIFSCLPPAFYRSGVWIFSRIP